jgi:hypothetical protein
MKQSITKAEVVLNEKVIGESEELIIKISYSRIVA